MGWVVLSDGSERFRLTRRKARHLYFTESAINSLKPKKKQFLVWDAYPDDRSRRGDPPARGLAVLVSPRGARSFRVVYYYPGSVKPHYLKLGRVGELSLVEARRKALEARALARAGRDPKAGDPAKSGNFEATFRDWVSRELHGKRQSKSADKTQGFVLKNCALWATRPVGTILPGEIEKLLEDVRDGDRGEIKPRPASAVRLHAHLGSFFSWCARPHGGVISVSPMLGMRPPTTLKGRERVYSADELRAIWAAAERLDNKLEGAYVRLVFLTALRREELAQAKWSEFEFDNETPTLFRVPFIRTKGRITRKPRDYLVPLPAYAARIVRSLPRHDADAVFKPINFQSLKERLVRLGAPSDFQLHVARHSIATWLQNAGCSEYDVALCLNHAGSGSVTSGYSHGFPLERKRELLAKWGDHIQSLTKGEGVVALV
jgi:integrase